MGLDRAAPRLFLKNRNMGFAKIMSGNLKPFRKGEARAVELGRKGGVASGISKRTTISELLKAELDKEDQTAGVYGNEPRGCSRRAAMVKGLVDRAVGGDPRAIMLVLQLERMEDQSVTEA